MELDRKPQELELIFRELGIVQYLDIFVKEGFDDWDTLLLIQESDLDALGVKPEHRRVLQRWIANARGPASSKSLASIIKPTAEEGKLDVVRKELPCGEGHNEWVAVANQTCRRRPKADDNAPDSPPSAYKLFSDEMREGIKSQSLTFTEIAKLVGENWQALAPTDREKHEEQANAALEKYHRHLAEYQETAEYRNYRKYRQEFKDKQS